MLRLKIFLSWWGALDERDSSNLEFLNLKRDSPGEAPYSFKKSRKRNTFTFTKNFKSDLLASGSNQYVHPNSFHPSFIRCEPSGESIMLLLKVGAVPFSWITSE